MQQQASAPPCTTMHPCHVRSNKGTEYRREAAPQEELMPFTHRVEKFPKSPRAASYFCCRTAAVTGALSLFQRLDSRSSSQCVFLMCKSVDLHSLYHATLAAPLLGADVSQGANVLEKVLDLLGSDGSVRCVPYCIVPAPRSSLLYLGKVKVKVVV